jgi:hypothetical protein
VERVLEQLRLARYAAYKPALSLPAAAGDAQIEAKLELLKNARSLLHEVEMAVAGFLMEPLILPERNIWHGFYSVPYRKPAMCIRPCPWRWRYGRAGMMWPI